MIGIYVRHAVGPVEGVFRNYLIIDVIGTELIPTLTTYARDNPRKRNEQQWRPVSVFNGRKRRPYFHFGQQNGQYYQRTQPYRKK